jgi:sporulation protein YlmC with PRC-barrel domain
MSGRILMATVAALALTMPAMAQDGTAPSNSEPQAAPQTEQQTEQGLPTEGAAEGAGEQAPAIAEEPPAATEQAPTMAEEPPAGTEQAPAMTEETPAATDEGPAMTEGQPTDQPADQQMAEEAPAPADMEFLQVQEEAQVLANDEVIGKEVVNDQDEKVGTIADLVMDQDQKLVGVVLSVGGFLGIGDKWVAVPVEQISFPSEDQPARLLAAATQEQLTSAPDFITRATIEEEQAAEAPSQAPAQEAPAPAVPAQ